MHHLGAQICQQFCCDKIMIVLCTTLVHKSDMILTLYTTGQYADTDTNIQALDQISYSRGRANMAAAFRAIRTEMFNGRRGDRTTAKNIAFVLTDGTNDVHREMTEPEAELTISSGIRCY